MNVILRWLLDLLQRFVRTLDWSLCAALFALMAIALAVLYSAGGDSGMQLVYAQGARYAVGLAAMWVLSRVTPPRLRDVTPLAYGATLVPLLLVLAIGTGRYGSHWIDLKLFYFQPSELLKLSLPMMAAWYLDRQLLPPRVGAVLATGVIIAVPTALVMLQPDFGTAMLVAISGAFVLFLAGLPWWWFAVAFGGVAGAAPVAWLWLLKPYQKDRILTFLDPESDPLGAGWNIIQSQLEIGSGGIRGQGSTQGSQSHLDDLPEHTTDFIFAGLAEEFGWIGVATVLVLYLFVAGRCGGAAGRRGAPRNRPDPPARRAEGRPASAQRQGGHGLSHPRDRRRDRSCRGIPGREIGRAHV